MKPLNPRATPRRLATCSFVLALAAAASACGGDSGRFFGDVPEDQAESTYAQVVCDLLIKCDCGFSLSKSECVDAATAQYQLEFDMAIAAGLIYDGECLGDFLEFVDRFGCGTQSDVLDDPQNNSYDIYACKVFSGNGGEGDPCSSYEAAGLIADDCSQGLGCIGSTCMASSTAPPPVKQPGESCIPGTEVCEAGAACLNSVDAPEVYTCTSLPVEGEGCDLGVCAAPAWCDLEDAICKPAPGIGEACDTFSKPCAEGLYCSVNTLLCETVLGEGEPCTQYDQCAAGLVCGEDQDRGGANVCRLEAPLACGG